MKTKAFILHTLCLAVIICAQAQKPSPAFTISAGISSAMYFSGDYESSSSDLKTGATAGISLRCPTGKHWGIEPGLFYVQKGGIETLTDGGYSAKFTTSLNYIEVPVDMFYSKRNRFFWGFGPAFGLGLSGKIKAEGESIDIKFGSGTDELKSFEIGLNLMGGFQFQNNLFIALNINTGLNDLSNDDSYNYSNSYLGIRLGYAFAKKQSSSNSK